MKKKYYNILNKIENAGFSSYIVGGYVRDFLLGKESNDIDIITNATPKDLKRIFGESKCNFLDYGAVKLTINNQIIDITTFRKELSYKDGKPIIEYTSSLEEDLKRRDFLINTLVMDKEGNIIDLLDARKDIENKVIRTVNDEKREMSEDPVRILRALRFMTVLNFKLSPSLNEFIINNKDLIKRIKSSKKKAELDKIFKSSNARLFFEYIKKHNLEEVLGLRIDNYIKTTTLIGMWSQITLLEDLPFTKYEKEQIIAVKSLINKGKLDKMDIYRNGLYISLIAGEILKISKKRISKQYKEIPINDRKDIKINAQEICEVLNITPGKMVGKAYSIIEEAIVYGRINNEKEDIIKFIRKEVH